MKKRTAGEQTLVGFTRREILLAALGFTVGGTAIALVTRWEADTVPKVAIEHLLGMSDAEKKKLVDSGEIFGIRHATVRVVDQRLFVEATKVATQYGQFDSTRNVQEVRYQLTDATGQIDGYADDRDASIQIGPNEQNQGGGEQIELVQGRLRYNPPADHPQDKLLPTGYFVQIELA